MAFNTVTVTTSPTLIIGDNPQRLSLIICNTSTATDIYIGQTTALTTANGVLLQAQANLTEDSGGTKMYCGPYYGIAHSGTVDCRFWERIR